MMENMENMDFLKIIVESKKKQVATVKGKMPESRLREQLSNPRQKRPFFKKLSKPGPSGINIIAEIKRASPSKGIICNELDPAVYAANYEQGGASAISVLTEQQYFKGSSEDLIKVRNAVTLPVLRKDFVISSYQIYESVVMEADAILLIVRILEQNQLKDYLDLCAELMIDALVEIYSEKDLEMAMRAEAKLIGINNRNLSSFKTNINVAGRMVSLLEPDQVAVAASGIQTREDIEKIKNSGIWNFLIGESLVRASNPKILLGELMGL